MKQLKACIARLCAISLLLASVVLQAAPDNLTREFDARYAAKFSGAKIEIESSFRRADSEQSNDSFVFRRWSEPKGLARVFRREGVLECAQFSLHQNKPVPSRYVYRDGDDGKGKSSKVTFDQSDAVAISDYNGETVQLGLSSQPVDKIVEEFVVARRLAAGDKKIALHVIERNEIHHVAYTYKGEESVEVPAGKFDAIVVERRRGESSRITRFWLAEELNYQPVKIERLRKGKSQGVARLVEFNWADQARGNVTPVCP